MIDLSSIIFADSDDRLFMKWKKIMIEEKLKNTLPTSQSFRLLSWANARQKGELSGVLYFSGTIQSTECRTAG